MVRIRFARTGIIVKDGRLQVSTVQAYLEGFHRYTQSIQEVRQTFDAVNAKVAHNESSLQDMLIATANAKELVDCPILFYTVVQLGALRASFHRSECLQAAMQWCPESAVIIRKMYPNEPIPETPEDHTKQHLWSYSSQLLRLTNAANDTFPAFDEQMKLVNKYYIGTHYSRLKYILGMTSYMRILNDREIQTTDVKHAVDLFDRLHLSTAHFVYFSIQQKHLETAKYLVATMNVPLSFKSTGNFQDRHAEITCLSVSPDFDSAKFVIDQLAVQQLPTAEDIIQLMKQNNFKAYTLATLFYAVHKQLQSEPQAQNTALQSASSKRCKTSNKWVQYFSNQNIVTQVLQELTELQSTPRRGLFGWRGPSNNSNLNVCIKACNRQIHALQNGTTTLKKIVDTYKHPGEMHRYLSELSKHGTNFPDKIDNDIGGYVYPPKLQF